MLSKSLKTQSFAGCSRLPNFVEFVIPNPPTESKVYHMPCMWDQAAELLAGLPEAQAVIAAQRAVQPEPRCSTEGFVGFHP
jgi:hypothetical protein